MDPGAAADEAVTRLSCRPPVHDRARLWRKQAGLLGSVAVVLAVCGCGAGETITVANGGGTVVTVAFADESVGAVEPDGGAVVYTDECLGRPIVTDASGRVVELAQSVCPGQQLRIDDTGAELMAQTERRN